MTRGKGCSPDIASRIVGLLMADVGIGCVYTPSPLAKPAAEVLEQPKPKKPRVRKVTPEVATYIRNSNGVPIPEILSQVQLRFGVQLSSGAIYKEWQSAHLSRSAATPTPAPRVPLGSPK